MRRRISSGVYQRPSVVTISLFTRIKEPRTFSWDMPMHLPTMVIRGRKHLTVIPRILREKRTGLLHRMFKIRAKVDHRTSPAATRRTAARSHGAQGWRADRPTKGITQARARKRTINRLVPKSRPINSLFLDSKVSARASCCGVWRRNMVMGPALRIADCIRGRWTWALIIGWRAQISANEG